MIPLTLRSPLLQILFKFDWSPQWNNDVRQYPDTVSDIYNHIYIYNKYVAIVSDTSWHIFGHNIYLYIIKQIFIYIYIVRFSAICCVTHVETFFHILLTMAWPIFWGVVGYLCPDIFPTIILIQSPTDIMIYLAGYGNYINAEPNVFFVSPNFQTGLFLC